MKKLKNCGFIGYSLIVRDSIIYINATSFTLECVSQSLQIGDVILLKFHDDIIDPMCIDLKKNFNSRHLRYYYDNQPTIERKKNILH